MSETELRSKYINLQLPYMGLSKDTLVQNLELHDITLKAMQMKEHKKPMHLPIALCAWRIMDQNRLLYLLAVFRVGALHAFRQF